MNSPPRCLEARDFAGFVPVGARKFAVVTSVGEAHGRTPDLRPSSRRRDIRRARSAIPPHSRGGTCTHVHTVAFTRFWAISLSLSCAHSSSFCYSYGYRFTCPVLTPKLCLCFSGLAVALIPGRLPRRIREPAGPAESAGLTQDQGIARSRFSGFSPDRRRNEEADPAAICRAQGP